MSTATDQDLDLSTFELTDEPVMCESIMERETLHMSSHPAQWYLRAPCGLVIAMCDLRRSWAMKMNGVLCRPGCEENHDWDDLSWTPIK